MRALSMSVNPLSVYMEYLRGDDVCIGYGNVICIRQEIQILSKGLKDIYNAYKSPLLR